MKNPPKHTCLRHRGYIVGYLLFGLSLMAVVTAGLVAIYEQQTSARITQTQREDLVNQALTIQTVILNCALLYPAGQNGAASGAPQFPATPSSGLVRDLVCPGTIDPSGSMLTVWRTLTQSGAASVNAPPQTIGFTPWQYINTQNGSGSPDVYFFIESESATDTRSAALLRSLANNRQLKDIMQLDTSKAKERLRSRNLADSLP